MLRLSDIFQKPTGDFRQEPLAPGKELGPLDVAPMTDIHTKHAYVEGVGTMLPQDKNEMFSQLYTEPLYVQPKLHYGITSKPVSHDIEDRSCDPASKITWNDARYKVPRDELLKHQPVPFGFAP